MKKKCEYLQRTEKLCVLSFDEIHIDSRLRYDNKLDAILGLFKKTQFALVRGLISAWKQPVYFDFDKQMDRNLLFHIIKSVQSTGVEITAIVSDLGGSQGLWKDLEITEFKSFFPIHQILARKFGYLQICLSMSNYSAITLLIKDLSWEMEQLSTQILLMKF